MQENERPQLELPLPESPFQYNLEEDEVIEQKRVIVIDLTLDEEEDEFVIDL